MEEDQLFPWFQNPSQKKLPSHPSMSWQQQHHQLITTSQQLFKRIQLHRTLNMNLVHSNLCMLFSPGNSDSQTHLLYSSVPICSGLITHQLIQHITILVLRDLKYKLDLIIISTVDERISEEYSLHVRLMFDK